DGCSVGSSCPGARTTTTGPSTARCATPVTRRNSVEPCQSSAALGEPMRDDLPPARTIAPASNTRAMLVVRPRQGHTWVLRIRDVATDEEPPHRFPRERALLLTVGEVMIANPKTLGADSGVGEVRRAFEHSNQRLVLLVDGARFRGAIDRDALDPQAPDSAP